MAMSPQPAPFHKTLAAHGLQLRKGAAHTLQVNTGLLCNLACSHCHLEAGPARTEIMSRQTMEAVASLARRIPFQSVDVTGGAPEMVPDIEFLLWELSPLAPGRLFRTNLLALEDNPGLIDTLAERSWSLVASLPAVNESQVASQRGGGVFSGSIRMLSRLNAAGFGMGGPRKLHLVSNPTGAFMPPAQASAEKFFRRELTGRRAINFDSLFVFANMPLGRFRSWLESSGNYQEYLNCLRERFNPDVVAGLMCRDIVSVGWDGRLYDCDFNQAAGLPSQGAAHVSDLAAVSEGMEIATGDHCYACTAGSGFT
jgi:radical SAM/Cys-rich protein